MSKHNLSLSMKLRVDSIKGPDVDLEKNAKRFPVIKPKFITGSHFDAPKAESLYERLSGSYQFESNMGVLTDRHPIAHPSTLCVRCSDAACMCMGCTETLCNNAVTFFRRSRAKGAAQLFANAIREAGMAKATRLMIFKLWKNGFQLRKRNDNKLKNVVERMFGNSCLFTPFKAWQRFTKQNVIDRKDRKLQECVTKIAQLEYQIRELLKEKAKSDAKVVDLQNKVDESADTFKDNQQFVKVLHTKIAEERVRVLGLSALVEQFMSSMKSSHDLIKKDLSHVGSQLLATSTIVASHDYDSIFSENDRKNMRLIRAFRTQRQFSVADNYYTDLQFENNFTTNILIQWINAQSIRASSRRVVGHKVDDYLPKYEVTTEWQSVQTGQQLCRVLVTIILDHLDSTNTLLDNYSKFGAGNGNPQEISEIGFGINQLQELQRFKNSPFFLVACCVQYSARFLNAPPFEIHGLRSDADMFKSFVCFLMNISNPVLMQKEIETLDRFSSEYVVSQTAFGDLITEFEELIHLRNVHRKFKALTKTTVEPSAANSFNPEGNLDGDGATESAVPLSSTKNINYAFEEDIIKTVYPLNTQGSRYDELAEAINVLIDSDNYPQNLVDVIQKSEKASSRQMTDLRNKIQVVLNKKAEGSRLANDIRTHAISSTTEAVLRRLKWLSEKLDAMPAVPVELA